MQYLYTEPSSRQPSPSSSTTTATHKENGNRANGNAEVDGHLENENEDELDAYELMSIDEIINGKVYCSCQFANRESQRTNCYSLTAWRIHWPHTTDQQLS